MIREKVPGLITTCFKLRRTELNGAQLSEYDFLCVKMRVALTNFHFTKAFLLLILMFPRLLSECRLRTNHTL